MFNPATFQERLQVSLSLFGVPMEAPKIYAFIERRSKELRIENPAKSRQTVHNWLKGKVPDAEGYAALSIILNVSTYWLITGLYRPSLAPYNHGVREVEKSHKK